ncbi:MAG: IS1380 family transposase, partial [Thiohalorhabdaceae bacterium]
FKEVSERQVSALEGLNHALRHRVWERARRSGAADVGGPGALWVDVDSTVKTVYGKQEGTAKGYNPHKPGARSYHPLLAFCAATKEILQGWQRPGDAHTGNGAVGFVHQLLAQMPAHQRVVIRADSGFFNGALLDALEEAGQGFLIKAKQTRALKRHLSTASWQPIPHQPGWEQCTMVYQAQAWSGERTVVAVRRRQEPEADPAQTALFDDGSYAVFAYVTSEALTPWQAHRRYGKRATAETWIEEAKNHMGLGHLKTAHFWAKTRGLRPRPQHRSRLGPTPPCSNAPSWPTTPCAGWPCKAATVSCSAGSPARSGPS